VFVARRPADEIAVPDALRRALSPRALAVVWENQLGGLTFEAVGYHDRVFVKWAPAGSNLKLGSEADRLEWARFWTAVPKVLDYGADETGQWLVTSALPGRSAVDERWRAEPSLAVAAIGEGLRALHDALPVEGCPFEWSVENRVAEARRRADAGEQQSLAWHESHRSLSVNEALAAIAEPPGVDRLVVCHGDACAPNTLLDDDGRWTGHVDFGTMGVADRWADLSIATWSTEWNYGPGWQPRLLQAYGIEPDLERTAYYRLLWDLT
jgi:kanamycin kinase